MWGNQDNVTGNNKPLYANVATTYGVSVTEKANTNGIGPHLAHSGWVKVNRGTGSVATITLANVGKGINTNGWVTFSGGNGSGANARYIVSTPNTNAHFNVVSTIEVLNFGSGYTHAPTAVIPGSNIFPALLTVTVGGRAGRNTSEVLIATGTITNDNPADNTLFPGT